MTDTVRADRRRVLAALATLALSGCAGCGDDDENRGSGEERPQAIGRVPTGEAPFVGRDAAFGVLRDAGLMLQRVRTRSAVAQRVRPAPVASARYAEKGGAQFDLLVFGSRRAAAVGEKSVLEARAVSDTTRSVNLVAAFPTPIATESAYAAVREALRELAAACEQPRGDARLRRTCFR